MIEDEYRLLCKSGVDDTDCISIVANKLSLPPQKRRGFDETESTEIQEVLKDHNACAQFLELLELDATELAEVLQVVINLHNQIPELLKLLSKNCDDFRWREKDNEVYSSNENNCYRIVARVGGANAGVHLSSTNVEEEFLLMSFNQFLSCCGDVLVDLDLCGRDLSGIDLSGKKVSDAKLNYGVLEQVDFSGATLEKLHIKSYGNSRIINMRRSDLHQTQLLECGLMRVDATGSDMRSVHIVGGTCYIANFSEANLSDAFIHGVDFSEVKFINANLSRANITEGKLDRVDFSGANLSGACITDVDLDEVQFSNKTIFNNTTITLKFPSWHVNSLDRYLNHLTNNTSTSLLMRIDAIDNKYKEQKLNLMHQIIDSLANVNTPSVHEAMLDIWMNNPI